MSINPSYSLLIEPYTVPTGDITFRNRLVLPSIPTWSSSPTGEISPEEIEFLRRRSRGVGMVISPPCAVADDGRMHQREWTCGDDRSLSGLRAVALAIRGEGALATLQLRHAGRLSIRSASGSPPKGPSHIPPPYPGAESPEEMNELEIELVIKAFGEGARRAILAGFDAVEIDGADGGLLQQFFSPHANHRRDQWGGGVENRATFPIAVLEEVREVVRRNAYRPFAIGFRLAPEEATEPGITLAESTQLIEGLVACRPDWIHISTNDYFAGSRRSQRSRRPLAALLSERIARRTGVLAAGSITTPSQSMSALADGADLVGVGRAMIVDPDWAEKVASGREEELKTCLPRHGADLSRTIPTPMYQRICADPDWIHLCSDPTETKHPIASAPSESELER